MGCGASSEAPVVAGVAGATARPLVDPDNNGHGDAGDAAVAYATGSTESVQQALGQALLDGDVALIAALELDAEERERQPYVGLSDGLTPLLWACAHSSHAVVCALLEARCDVTARSSCRRTALMLSVCNTHGNGRAAEQIVGELLGNPSVDVRATDSEHYTAFMYACQHAKSTRVVAALLEANLDINGVDLDDSLCLTTDGSTALMLATGNQNDRDATILKLLLGADRGDHAKQLQRCDNYGCTALHRACMYSPSAEHIKTLLNASADPERLAYGGVTLLMLAAQNRHADTVLGAMLHQREGHPHTGMDWTSSVDRRSDHGWTALHFACHAQNPAAVELLVTACCNTALTTETGQTALMLAAQKEKGVETCRVLLEWCDDELEAKDPDGNTAKALAVAAGHVQTAELLAELEARAEHNRSATGASRGRPIRASPPPSDPRASGLRADLGPDQNLTDDEYDPNSGGTIQESEPEPEPEAAAPVTPDRGRDGQRRARPRPNLEARPRALLGVWGAMTIQELRDAASAAGGTHEAIERACDRSNLEAVREELIALLMSIDSVNSAAQQQQEEGEEEEEEEEMSEELRATLELSRVQEQLDRQQRDLEEVQLAQAIAESKAEDAARELAAQKQAAEKREEEMAVEREAAEKREAERSEAERRAAAERRDNAAEVRRVAEQHAAEQKKLEVTVSAEKDRQVAEVRSRLDNAFANLQKRRQEREAKDTAGAGGAGNSSDPKSPKQQQGAAEKLEAALAAMRARREAKQKATGKKVVLSREALQKEARRLFQTVDKDRSGLLDAGEVKQLAKKLKLELSEEDAQIAMEKMDADGSGEVDFDEFFGWYVESI